MKRSKELTARQREIYEFIRDKIRSRGYGPTVREIGDEFGISSPNGVVSHLRALQKKGAIVRHAGMSRAIELVKEGPTSLQKVGSVNPGSPFVEVKDGPRVDLGPLFKGKNMGVIDVTGKQAAQSELNEGDLLVVDQKGSARNGQAVIAVLANGNGAVGLYKRDKDTVKLEPIGGKGRTVTAKKPKIVGVVVACVRMLG